MPTEEEPRNAASLKPRLAIVLQSGLHNRLYAAISLVTTAVAQGGEAHLFLTHAALKAYLTQTLDDAEVSFGDEEYDAFYREARDYERVPSLTELLEQARARGTVKIYGCQASVILWRRYTPAQLDRLDAVLGHSTFLTIAHDLRLLVI